MLNKKEWIDAALSAREQAYAPYSGYKVGAALLGKSGRIYLGFNIENAAYSATICAERAAFAAALTQGEREFEGIAIAGGREKAESNVPPCGVCRQVMAEFCGPDFLIIWGNEEYQEQHSLSELLPFGFDQKNLED